MRSRRRRNRIAVGPEIMTLRAEPDLAARLRGHAVVSTALARRITPFVLAVRAAAASEPAAADLVAEMDRQRYEGLGAMARAAARSGQLGVAAQAAHDVIWATTDGSLWHRLVVGRGWTDERYASWLANVWISALVVDANRSD
jgi:hypothetical protein